MAGQSLGRLISHSGAAHQGLLLPGCYVHCQSRDPLPPRPFHGIDSVAFLAVQSLCSGEGLPVNRLPMRNKPGIHDATALRLAIRPLPRTSCPIRPVRRRSGKGARWVAQRDDMKVCHPSLVRVHITVGGPTET